MDFVRTVKIKFSEEEKHILDRAWEIFELISQNGSQTSTHDIDAGKICEAITDFLEDYDADWER